ncbi:MAG: hypothetical protein ACPGLV_15900 [Bacteroidia bacterium]
MSSCEYRVSTWHRLHIKNDSDYKLKIVFVTKNDTGEFELPIFEEGKQTSWITDFYIERIDSEKKLDAYSQEEFDERIKSLRVYRYENDTTAIEVFNDIPFTDINIWKVRFSHDDEMDNYYYWLHIDNDKINNL